MRTAGQDDSILYRAGVLLAVLVLGLLAYALSVWAWNSPVELGAYDMLLRMRPAAAPRSDIVIVGIDEESTSSLGRPPLPRTVHARIVARLRRAGAKVIVYDKMFAQPSTSYPGSDSALQRAFSASGNVFLPMVYDPLRSTSWTPSDIRSLIALERDTLAERISYLPETPNYRYYFFVPPLSGFLGAAKGSGVAVSPSNGSYFVRSAQLAYLTRVLYPVPSRPLPRSMPMPRLTDRVVVMQGLPLVVAKNVLGDEGGLSQVHFGRSISLFSGMSPYQVPIDEQGAMHIDFAGAAGTYPNYSAADLLAGSLDSSLFENKIVLVGVTDPTSSQAAIFNTPFGRMPRVEITANAIASILGGTAPVRRQKETLVVFLLLSIILGLTLPLFGRWSLGPITFVLALAYIVLDVLSLALLHRAFPVVPGVVLILAAGIVTALLRPAVFVDEDTGITTEEEA
jgi:CHASE2 domain-containing sensor protein